MYCGSPTRGVATGDIWVYIYTPKISPSTLLWDKNDVKTAIYRRVLSFISPPQKKKKLYPLNKFLATPCPHCPLQIM